MPRLFSVLYRKQSGHFVFILPFRVKFRFCTQSPCFHGLDDGLHGFPQRAEGVLHTGRHLWENRTHYKAVHFHRTQAVGQHLLADVIQIFVQFKELAASCTSAEDFTAAMKAAFPNYAGDNYLEMTAGYLIQ